MAEANTVLEIQDLCVKVKDKELLHDLNLTIPFGEVHALLGQNGSGKTSLMMAIMGFSGYEVTHGHIFFAGKEITDMDLTQRARLGMCIAEQRPPTIRGVKLRSIIDYVFRNKPHHVEAIDELTQLTRTSDFLDRDINEGLSGGEIRRAELMQLLAIKPMFSMLDEPDSGLDMESLSSLGKLINRLLSSDVMHPAKRKSGLLITHNGDILNYVNVDKAHIMMNGQIKCSGNPRLMMETISRHGYEACIHCMQERGA